MMTSGCGTLATLRYWGQLAARGGAPILWAKLSRPGIQLTIPEIDLVFECLRQQTPCHLLVFGLGHDAGLWARLNRQGRTVFLEDNAGWIGRVAQVDGSLETYKVHYRTRLSTWREDLAGPRDQLAIPLPESMRNVAWDVILIDGPAGEPTLARLGIDPPGRLSSIYMASLLAAPGTDIFVHDGERMAEEAACEQLLGHAELIGQVRGRALLKHLRIPAPTNTV